MLKKKKLIRLLMLAIISIWEQIALAQDYIISQGSQVKVNISAKGVNRIAIENDRIAQVIGNEDEYFLESDPNLGQVFLTSALKASSEISLRFITERDKIIDAKLLVSPIDPQTIVFKYKAEEGKISNIIRPGNLKPYLMTGVSTQNAYEYKMSNFGNDDSTNQLIDLIKHVYNKQNTKDTEIQTLSCLDSNSSLKNLKIVRANVYGFKKYNVIKAVVQNKSKNLISLKEQDFVGCMRIINAVALDKDYLNPKESIDLYMVGSDGR